MKAAHLYFCSSCAYCSLKCSTIEQIIQYISCKRLWSLGTLNSNPYWNTYFSPQINIDFVGIVVNPSALGFLFAVVFGRYIIAWYFVYGYLFAV